jgi:hypothetical protein
VRLVLFEKAGDDAAHERPKGRPAGPLVEGPEERAVKLGQHAGLQGRLVELAEALGRAGAVALVVLGDAGLILKHVTHTERLDVVVH